MTGAFLCSECGYENVVSGCGFCLQCGAEFSQPPPPEITVGNPNEVQHSEEGFETVAPTVGQAVPVNLDQGPAIGPGVTGVGVGVIADVASANGAVETAIPARYAENIAADDRPSPQQTGDAIDQETHLSQNDEPDHDEFAVDEAEEFAVSVAAGSPRTAFDDEAAVHDELPQFAASLLTELDAVIDAAAKQVNMRIRKENDRMVAQSVIDGRPQLVFVDKGLNADGAPALSLYAVCGPATAENALPLLEWNRALNHSSFAVRSFGEKKMFVIQSSVFALTVDQLTLSRTMSEIAKRANQVNERLIG